MRTISWDIVKEYRERTYRTIPELLVSNIDEAVNFVEERGFIFFWPIQAAELPSLWKAVSGDRPVAANHDDPGHVTWGWKDSLLGKRKWYYAKVLRKKATIISKNVLPYFYALSVNYGSPEEDYLIQYHDGNLTYEEKSLYEALLDNGPLDTLTLRRKTGMSNPSDNARFQRARVRLQTDFRILPVGISRAGGWRYAYIYGLVHNHFPDLPYEARQISDQEAREKLMQLQLKSLGAARKGDVQKLFQWDPRLTESTIMGLVKQKTISDGISIEGKSGKWITTMGILQNHKD